MTHHDDPHADCSHNYGICVANVKRGYPTK